MDGGVTSANKNAVHTGSSDSYPGTKGTCSSSLHHANRRCQRRDVENGEARDGD